MFCLKSHGCQPNCMFFGVFFFCMFRVLLAPIFSHIQSWMGSITWTCCKCMQLTIADIQDQVFHRFGAPPHQFSHVRAYLGMPGLDGEALLLGPSCLQFLHLLTFSSGSMPKTWSTRLLSMTQTTSRKKKKILESVRSVTVDIIAATWRELRKRLVVIIEHNDDHVEAYHH